MNTKWTPGTRQRRRRVDPPDRRSGEGAAHEARVQHPRQRDVVDVRAPAGEQPGVLDAVDARADVPGGARGSASVMTVLHGGPCRRPGAPPRRCPGSRCSGRGCPTAPRGSRSSVGFGWSRRNAVTDTTKPGVQKPHCSPWQSRNAACTVERSPSGEPMPFDRRDLGAVGLHREHEARAHGGAVDQHRARAAHAVLAAEVRAGEVALLAEEVGERHARFDGRSCLPDRSPSAAPAPHAWRASVAAVGPRARHHGGAHSLAVRGGAVQVGGDRRQTGHGQATDLLRLDVGDRPARELGLGRCGPLGRRPEADQADGAAPDPVVGVELDADRRTRDREVAVPARELLDRESARARPRSGTTRRRGARRAPCSCSRGRRRSRPPRWCADPSARRPPCSRRAPGRRPGTRPPGRRARSNLRACRGCGSGSDR